ncbi:MAG: hypothetical protein HQL91_02855 [Magnetococcales bacterium]|nr:hypothetical protein [Magnetococcales bacterium]
MKTLIVKPDSPFKQALIACPVCGNHPMHIYRCAGCGEVRCGSDQCIGSMGTEYKRWARAGTICRHCNEATYRQIVSDSEEMQQFLAEYRRPWRPRSPASRR